MVNDNIKVYNTGKECFIYNEEAVKSKYGVAPSKMVELMALMGDPTKVKKILGWEHTVSIDQLIEEMITVVTKEEQKE